MTDGSIGNLGKLVQVWLFFTIFPCEHLLLLLLLMLMLMLHVLVIVMVIHLFNVIFIFSYRVYCLLVFFVRMFFI